MKGRRCATGRYPRVATSTALVVTVPLLLISCVTDVSHDCVWGSTVVKVRYEVTSTTGMADIEVLDVGVDVMRYRREQTPWRLTERVRGDTLVRLRARNSRPLGTVTVAIYVDDVLWKRASGLGAGTAETDGVIRSEPGWDCGADIFMQTYQEKPAQPVTPG